jgi:hypothetical protein
VACSTSPQSFLAPWTRKHDKPGTPYMSQAPVIYYPQTLEDLICICANRDPDTRLHAAGSHWALSTAAVSDHSFIETHDWNQVYPAMGRTLHEVVPGCLTTEFLDELNYQSNDPASEAAYFVHFESGKRIYQLYSELDVGDGDITGSLCDVMKQQYKNTKFAGSWAFHTLGGAGGQTVVGALSTGTHGGDFDRPPLADMVVALHIVVDGGKQYWIEKSKSPSPRRPPLTDEAKLRALYGQAKYGGPTNFEVIYDDDVWRAAIVQVGRFGVVYSAVLQVVPQYGLYQKVSQDDSTNWENVSALIAHPGSDLYNQTYTTKSGQSVQQRFLQIVINPIPAADGSTHIGCITRHWQVPLGDVDTSPLPAVAWSDSGAVAGRAERVGNIVVDFDPVLNAPRFSEAGLSVAYSAAETGVTSFDAFEFACQDGDFMDGLVSAIYTEIVNYISNHYVEDGGAIAAVIALSAVDTLFPLIPALLAILAILAAFLESLRGEGKTAGQALNNLRSSLLDNAITRAAGLLIWRAIANEVFKKMQVSDPYSAISYAIMDVHDYTDISCTVNVRSVEVFFNATDPNLVAFVDRLLQFESDQETNSGDSAVGYISLRFCQQTAALLGPEMFESTVAVECSALADDDGSVQFVDYAVTLALDPNINGILHWGQQNDSTQQDIEFRFGDSPGSPTGPLHDWRAVLSQLTNGGSLDGFSSDFTRQTGLEVT